MTFSDIATDGGTHWRRVMIEDGSIGVYIYRERVLY